LGFEQLGPDEERQCLLEYWIKEYLFLPLFDHLCFVSSSLDSRVWGEGRVTDHAFINEVPYWS